MNRIKETLQFDPIVRERLRGPRERSHAGDRPFVADLIGRRDLERDFALPRPRANVEHHGRRFRDCDAVLRREQSATPRGDEERNRPAGGISSRKRQANDVCAMRPARRDDRDPRNRDLGRHDIEVDESSPQLCNRPGRVIQKRTDICALAAQPVVRTCACDDQPRSLFVPPRGIPAEQPRARDDAAASVTTFEPSEPDQPAVRSGLARDRPRVPSRTSGPTR